MICDLGDVAQIPLGEGRQFRIGNVDVAVFRTRDQGVFATQASCPHRRGPLADGLVGAGTVICPLHGFRFDLATGRAIGSSCGPLTTYPVSVSPEGHVLLECPSASARGRRHATA